MRRRTPWLLGGVLAGTVVLGASGTFAVLSDSEEAVATAGAASLRLDVEAPALLQLGPQRTPQEVRATVTGGVPAVLQVSLAPTAGDCADLPARLTVTGPEGTRSRDVCRLAGDPLEVAHLGPEHPTAELSVSVAGTGTPPPGLRQVTWPDGLVLTLVQDPAGFSDERRLDVHVVLPPGQLSGNANGNDGSPGGGNGGRNGRD
ncbi:hypothetical protein GCM10027261_43230 [Geodermatophilus arenarius]|uniref:SipW-cognate class signal peptide n=1 Tax=Geodermatophilus arenarius TaxID=1137990 RepID=A0ABV9LQH2_9ACTN